MTHVHATSTAVFVYANFVACFNCEISNSLKRLSEVRHENKIDVYTRRFSCCVRKKMQMNSYFEVVRDGKHCEDHRVSAFSRDYVLRILKTILLLPFFLAKELKEISPQSQTLCGFRFPFTSRREG